MRKKYYHYRIPAGHYLMIDSEHISNGHYYCYGFNSEGLRAVYIDGFYRQNELLEIAQTKGVYNETIN